MEPYNTEKFKIMEDEMNRFESEIGLPNIPESEISKPLVIGTDTFNQAQRKIHEIEKVSTDGDNSFSSQDIFLPPTSSAQAPSLFIPHQVLHRGQIPRPAVPTSAALPVATSSSVLPISTSTTDSSPIVLPPPPPPGLVFPPRPNVIPFLPAQGFPHAIGPMIPRSAGMPGPRIPPVMPPGHMTFIPANSAPMYPNHFVRSAHMSMRNHAPNKPALSETPIILSATPKLYTKPDQETTEKSTENEDDESAQSNNLSSDISVKIVKRQKIPTTKESAINDPTHHTGKKKDKKSKRSIRVSGGQTWEDPTLGEWEDGDFRLFCGDLGNDVTDELLTRIFSIYPSFLKARVVRDKRTNKTKGFGFISFKDPQDFIRATKEMNGRYVGSRPIKLRKSTWKNRNLDVVKKKEKEKAALIALLTGK